MSIKRILFIILIFYTLTTAFSQNNRQIVDSLLRSSERRFTSYPDLALIDANKALEIAKSLNDDNLIINSLLQIGKSNYHGANYNKAITNYNNARISAENLGLSILEGDAINGLALVYLELQDFDNSQKLNRKALKIRKINNDSFGLRQTYNNIGMAYFKKDNFDSALFYYTKSHALVKNTKSLNAIYSLINISNVYSATKNYKAAILNYKKALKIAESFNQPTYIFMCNFNIGSLYRDQGDFNKAFDYYKHSRKILDTLSNINLEIHYHHTMYETFAMQNEFEKALFHYKKSKTLNDSVLNIEAKNHADELKEKYESVEKEKKIAIQNLTISQKNRIINIMILVTIIIILLLGVILYQYRQKSLAYKKLVEENIKNALTPPQTLKIQPNDSSDDTLLNIYNKLEGLMRNEKIYLDKSLRLEPTAEQLNTNRTYLSNALKEYANKSFNNYINEYRIYEAKLQLISTEFDHFSIEGIGNNVGFQSKTTFNNVFKDLTGVTPSFFRKNRIS